MAVAAWLSTGFAVVAMHSYDALSDQTVSEIVSDDVTLYRPVTGEGVVTEEVEIVTLPTFDSLVDALYQ